MLSRRRFFVSSGAALLGSAWRSSLSGVVSPKSDERAFGAELDEMLLARMQASHVPGMSFAIVRKGQLLRTAGLGFADLETRRPMQANTLINIASVTKTITCTAAMQLWEQGAFKFEDDVNRYLPFKVRNPHFLEAPITFEQLLTHTSSLADGPAYLASYSCGDPRRSLREWLQSYLTVSGSLYSATGNFHPRGPGEQHAYSNVAFGLLGLLIEQLSGTPYMQYVERHVFAPLGMSDSRFLLAGMNPNAHATPYSYESANHGTQRVLVRPNWKEPVADEGGSIFVPHCFYSFATPPDGLARTSARELVRLLLAYMHGGALHGRQILKAGTVTKILSNQPMATQDTQSDRIQGLAWYGQKKLGPGLIWGHTGDDPGVVTLMAFRPSDQSGLIVLTNSDQGASVAIAIAQRVFDDAP